ncbi:MAG: hypothetical protein M0C28_32370 [Candidatus Moduliflexus flocculans]|nr:hypothetical protein [Candidatus Moduliflexus flocculans]
MLGVVANPVETVQDVLMRETAAEIGREGTYRPTPVAVYFGKEGEPAADPYFEGEGPDRVGCELCGDVHDRLPQGRQEQPGQELPLLRREVRRPGLRREPRRRHRPPVARRRRGLPRPDPEDDRAFPRPARPRLPDQGPGPRRGDPGHQRPAPRPEAAGPPAEPVRTSRPLHPDQQRDPARRAELRARDRLHPGRGHHLERPSRRGHPPRAGPLRQGSRRHVRARRRADRRRQTDPAHPPLAGERAPASGPAT